jgi:hypothetical protein
MVKFFGDVIVQLVTRRRLSSAIISGDYYDKAVASANDGDRQDALAFLEGHLKRRN